MTKDDLRKLKKATELVDMCLNNLEKIPQNFEQASKAYSVISTHRSSFYHIFYDGSNISPLFLYLMPVDKMNSLIALLNVMAFAQMSSSNGTISSDRVTLRINDLMTLLKEFRDILSASLMRDSYKIFYSWQSDLPNNTNRNFIEIALEKAIKNVQKEYQCPFELDKDTKERSGSPEIAKVILEKIDTCMAFVADISFIGENDRKKTPNPNVLLELGYALSSLGDENVILILNKATGSIEDLPFDLRGKRILNYNCQRDLPNEDLIKARENLTKCITGALKLICKNNIR